VTFELVIFDCDGVLIDSEPIANRIFSEQLAKVGMCADPTCRWLFYDTTRSGTRRWCDMKSCGNRNKVRRFRGTDN